MVTEEERMESNSEDGQQEGGHSSKVSQWTVSCPLTIFLLRSDHLNHFCLQAKYQFLRQDWPTGERLLPLSIGATGSYSGCTYVV